jgi:pilus assembly protein CpaB
LCTAAAGGLAVPAFFEGETKSPQSAGAWQPKKIGRIAFRDFDRPISGALPMRRLTPAGVSTMMVVVVGALVTAYFAKLMRAEEPHVPIALTTPNQVEYGSVPTAAGNLEPGTVITAAQLTTGRVRVAALDSDVLLQDRLAIGRTVKERIAAGSIIRTSRLYSPGETAQLSVSRGMRAVSIPLPRNLASMGGLLKPGQYVDVYLTPRNDAGNDGRLHGGMTLTLFRGVRLLSVATGDLSDEASGGVTLELTPEQATMLILAREKGSLALSYNPEGKGEGGLALKNRDRATLDEILGLNREAPSTAAPSETAVPAPNAAPAATFTAELYLGRTRTTRQFDARAKVDSTPATSTPINSWRSAPLWTRRTPARSRPVPAVDRVVTAPDGPAIR